jgi:hypothetical protein
MKHSFRKRLIFEILRRTPENAFVTTAYLCEILGNRKAVLRDMAHLARKGAVTPVYRYVGPGVLNSRGGPNFLQEIIFVPSYKKLRELLEPKGKTPSQLSGWARMWRTIRAAKRFTRADLCMLAGVSMSNAIYFTKQLRKAGYIRQRTRGTWELMKDPGPRRPRLASIEEKR